VRCGADERRAPEQLCRYITRPALANERMQYNANGQVVLRRKTTWRDVTTHLVMTPLESVRRLAGWVGASATTAAANDGVADINLGSRIPALGAGTRSV